MRKKLNSAYNVYYWAKYILNANGKWQIAKMFYQWFHHRHKRPQAIFRYCISHVALCSKHYRFFVFLFFGNTFSLSRSLILSQTKIKQKQKRTKRNAKKKNENEMYFILFDIDSNRAAIEFFGWNRPFYADNEVSKITWSNFQMNENITQSKNFQTEEDKRSRRSKPDFDWTAA